MEKLFSEFTPVDTDTWKKRIESDLKGISFDSLLKTNRSGITIKPFYNQDDVRSTSTINASGSWDICAKINVSDEKVANAHALEQLQNGVSGLIFVINGKKNIAQLLDKISIQHIYTQFIVAGKSDEFIQDFSAYLSSQQLSWNSLHTSIIHDELNYLIQHQSYKTNEADFKNSFINSLKASEYASFSVDATIYNNAGANSVYELSCALAQVNEYFTIANEHNLISKIKQITVCLATDTNFFEEIAKLRALRHLVTLLAEQYDVKAKLHLHCETSDIYRAQFDSYSNLLRDTISGMAAVIGNCNSLCVHHFNDKDADTKLATRMSRNQQLIFKEESYLDKVQDISNGSFYIEALTEEIAKKAWEEFKHIESEGGFIASVLKGTLKSNIEAQAAQLVAEYKEGKRTLIGINKFPNANDKPVSTENKGTPNKGINALSLTSALIV